jgi:hypothetical protein
VLAVGALSARPRDDGAAQHFGDGDRDQAYLRGGVGVAVQGDGDGQVDAGEQAQGAPAVPGPPADHLAEVQSGGLLGELVIFFDFMLALDRVSSTCCYVTTSGVSHLSSMPSFTSPAGRTPASCGAYIQ